MSSCYQPDIKAQVCDKTLLLTIWTFCQEQIFKDIGIPAVTNVINGINSTLIIYGQVIQKCFLYIAFLLSAYNVIYSSVFIYVTCSIEMSSSLSFSEEFWERIYNFRWSWWSRISSYGKYTSFRKITSLLNFLGWTNLNEHNNKKNIQLIE